MFKTRMLRRSVSCLLLTLYCSCALTADINRVDVYQAKVSQQKQILTLTGTVEAKQNANLATLQSGVVAELFVEVGDQVEQGQRLLSLDAKLAELSLKQSKALKTAAQAEKNEAERLYKEVVKLSTQQLVAETLLAERLSGLEIAKAKLGRADAELRQQQEVLARHSLYAPFAGIIAQRHIDLGEWVTQQTSVFTLVEQDNLRLNIAIPQEYVSQFNGASISKQAIEVVVTPDFTNASSLKATLSRLVAVASNSSRTVTGLVDLPNDSNLVVGMSARAEIELPANNQVLVWLPKSAIKQHPDGGSSVFTVANNQAKRVLVKVVEKQGQQVAIIGANAEKPFIITGVELLQDGDAVTVNQIKGTAL